MPLPSCPIVRHTLIIYNILSDVFFFPCVSLFIPLSAHYQHQLPLSALCLANSLSLGLLLHICYWYIGLQSVCRAFCAYGRKPRAGLAAFFVLGRSLEKNLMVIACGFELSTGVEEAHLTFGFIVYRSICCECSYSA